MHVVILHYHLRAGGVTHIIDQQVRALQEEGAVSITVLSGSAPDASFATFDHVQVMVEPALDYWSCAYSPEEAKQRKEACEKALRAVLTPESVLHVHNPTLGKNPALTMVLSELVYQGLPIVYHCHDFIEDRPHLWANVEAYHASSTTTKSINEVLYPQASNVAYVVLNHQDALRPMMRARHAVVISNPVVFVPHPTSLTRQEVAKLLGLPVESLWVLYPVRGIARKNLGELILLSLLLPSTIQWCLSLAPENEEEKELYNLWVSLAEELQAPIHFNVGAVVPYAVMIEVCDAVVTTSIQEGFGMTFLEPLLLTKPLIGRRLPIIGEFENLGITFPGLYEELSLEYKNHRVDFATLHDDEKRALLDHLGHSTEALQEARTNYSIQREQLMQVLQSEGSKENATLVRQHFSLDAFRAKCLQLYKKLLN